CDCACGRRTTIDLRYEERCSHRRRGERSRIHAHRFLQISSSSRPNLCFIRVNLWVEMKRILITGASRGIGRAIGQKLAAPDVTLLLHGRDTVALAETCKTVQGHCAGVVKLIHDLATEKGVANLISQVGGDPLDVLINNAGIAVVKPFREITPEEWKQTLWVNVSTP